MNQRDTISAHWTRDRIEQVWDVFAKHDMAFDRQSMYYDEGADSEFCEMHRQQLVAVLDEAGLVAGEVTDALCTTLDSVARHRDRIADDADRIGAENQRLRQQPDRAVGALERLVSAIENVQAFGVKTGRTEVAEAWKEARSTLDRLGGR